MNQRPREHSPPSGNRAADPKAFHATRVEPKSPEQSGWMIYALTGDALQIGFYDALKARPEGFEPREELVVLELSRAAAGPKAKTPVGGASQDNATSATQAPVNAPLEGTVLDVLPDGMIRVSLGTDNGLRVGDLLQVRRPAQDGSLQSLAVIVVKAAEGTTANCLVLRVASSSQNTHRQG